MAKNSARPPKHFRQGVEILFRRAGDLLVPQQLGAGLPAHRHGAGRAAADGVGVAGEAGGRGHRRGGSDKQDEKGQSHSRRAHGVSSHGNGRRARWSAAGRPVILVRRPRNIRVRIFDRYRHRRDATGRGHYRLWRLCGAPSDAHTLQDHRLRRAARRPLTARNFDAVSDRVGFSHCRHQIRGQRRCAGAAGAVCAQRQRPHFRDGGGGGAAVFVWRDAQPSAAAVWAGWWGFISPPCFWCGRW